MEQYILTDWLQRKQKLRAKFSAYKVPPLPQKRQQMSGLPFGFLIILFIFVGSDFISFINHKNNFRKPQTSSCKVKYFKQSCVWALKIPRQTYAENLLQSPWQHNEQRWPERPSSCGLRAHAPILQWPSILSTACRPLLMNEVTPEPRWADRLQNKIYLGADVGGIETNNQKRKQEMRVRSAQLYSCWKSKT